MDVRTEITRLSLGASGTMVLDRALGVEVIGHKGCVWLTQYGDSRDVVLGPGQSFALADASDVVITSARGAEFILRSSPCAAPAPRGWLQRFAGWFDARARSRACAAQGGRVSLHRVA